MFKVIKVSFNIDTDTESEELVLHTPVKDFADRIRDEINAEDQIPGHENFAVTIKLF